MSNTPNKFSPEVHERAVRLVLDNEGQHGSRWQAIVSIAAKIGCSAKGSAHLAPRARVARLQAETIKGGPDLCRFVK